MTQLIPENDPPDQFFILIMYSAFLPCLSKLWPPLLTKIVKRLLVPPNAPVSWDQTDALLWILFQETWACSLSPLSVHSRKREELVLLGISLSPLVILSLNQNTPSFHWYRWSPACQEWQSPTCGNEDLRLCGDHNHSSATKKLFSIFILALGHLIHRQNISYNFYVTDI